MTSIDIKDQLVAGTIEIKGSEGDLIEAYYASPVGEGPYSSMVVIHHMPGFDDATKEIARNFAYHGYRSICPNLYSREAPGASPDDAAAAARALGGVPDARLVGDVSGAVEFLRAQADSTKKVAVIGYCSGGRQSFLAACSLDLDAAIDCYGAYVVASPPEGAPLKVGPILDKAKDLSCPLLGLFGDEDKFPTPEEVAELDRVLTQLGKEHEFHSYPGAGHAFFAPNRPSYRVEAANDGWQRIWSFLGKHL